MGISVGDAISGTGTPNGATVISKTTSTVTMSANATTTGTGRNIRFHNGTIRYETIGTSPNRKLVVQFSKFSRFSPTGGGDFMNFQIVLNESSNIIDLIYDFQYINSTGSNIVGLRGNVPTDFNGRTTTTNWSATTLSPLNTSSCSVSNTIFPASGLTFTYTPSPICDATIVVGAIISPTVANLCAGATRVFNVPALSPARSGYTYQWETSPDGTLSWTAVTTGTGGTTLSYTTPAYVSGTQYYRLAVSCPAASTTIYSNNIGSVSGQIAPVLQAKNIISATSLTTTLTISWTNGGGNNRSVFINNSNFFIDPISGISPGTPTTIYSATATTQQLVYDGTATSVNVTGLMPNTTYYFRVYESNKCVTPNYFYNTITEANNPASFTTAALPLTSVASGNWSDGSTWNTGVVPICSDVATVSATHVVTVNSTLNVIKNLTIANGGSLVIASGDLTVGCTNNNNILSNKGTLSVNGGTLNLNGNYAGLLSSIFNQSGGEMIIDGNNGGVALGSVASGTRLFSSLSNLINLSGGTLTFVDPHVQTAGTITETFYLNNSSTSTNTLVTNPNYITKLGNGVSSDKSDNIAGFRMNTWESSTFINFGKLIIDSGNVGVNRNVTSTYNFLQMAILKLSQTLSLY